MSARQPGLSTKPDDTLGVCYLDTLEPATARTGFGSVGRGGELGYEGRKVTVQGRLVQHSVSAHAPSRLTYTLKEAYQSFNAIAAFDDAVPFCGVQTANFRVYVDQILASTAQVTPGRLAHICADLRGAKSLCLVIDAAKRKWAHTVWVEPQLELRRAISPNNPFHDALNRVRIEQLPVVPRVCRCIVTMASAGFEHHLADLLGSLAANGKCEDIPCFVFVVGNAPGIDRIVAAFNCVPIRCEPVGPINATLKSAMYSIGHLVPADHFLCLDCDMLVLGTIRPLFDALTACCKRSILVVRESNSPRYASLRDAVKRVYHTAPKDFYQSFPMSKELLDYPLVVNDGLLAGSRDAFLNLDRCIRGFAGIVEWIDEKPELGYRNQFVLNLALAKLSCGVEASGDFNVQANYQRIDFRQKGSALSADWSEGVARVVHFCGNSRNMYPEFRGVYGSSLVTWPRKSEPADIEKTQPEIEL